MLFSSFNTLGKGLLKMSGRSPLGMGTLLGAAGGYAAYNSFSSNYNVNSNPIGDSIGSSLYSVFDPDRWALNAAVGFGSEYIGGKMAFGGKIPFGKNFGSPWSRLANAQLGTSVGNTFFNGKVSRDVLQKIASGDASASQIASTFRKVTGSAIGSKAGNQYLRSAGFTGSEMARIRAGTGLRRLGALVNWGTLAVGAFQLGMNAIKVTPRQVTPRPPQSTGLGGTFMDSDVAFTQRRRALQVIHDSQYSGRAGLGNESSLMHR